MSKEEIIRKLTSRKFWALIAGLVTSIILMLQGDQSVTIGAIVMSSGSIIAYILGEAWTDSNNSDN